MATRSGLRVLANLGLLLISTVAFADDPPTIELLDPNGGEILRPGSIHPIQWTASDDIQIDHIGIAYSTGITVFGSTTSGSTGPSSFYELSFGDGSAILIGAIGFNRVGAMDQHPGTGVIYATAQRSGDNTPVLITIDPLTGQGSEVGPTGAPGSITDLSFRPDDNVLYGQMTPSSGFSSIYVFDIITGQATSIGLTNTAGGGGGPGLFSNKHTVSSAHIWDRES